MFPFQQQFHIYHWKHGLASSSCPLLPLFCLFLATINMPVNKLCSGIPGQAQKKSNLTGNCLHTVQRNSLEVRGRRGGGGDNRRSTHPGTPKHSGMPYSLCESKYKYNYNKHSTQHYVGYRTQLCIHTG